MAGCSGGVARSEGVSATSCREGMLLVDYYGFTRLSGTAADMGCNVSMFTTSGTRTVFKEKCQSYICGSKHFHVFVISCTPFATCQEHCTSIISVHVYTAKNTTSSLCITVAMDTKLFTQAFVF